MEKIEKLEEGQNYSAISIGNMSNQQEKVFIKDAVKATGTEISFEELPSHKESRFYHTHKQNEEIYIVLKGFGDFQVDGDIFPVAEGSIVRVAPNGVRALRSGDEPMLYMVIQSREGSLNQYTMTDGNVVERKIEW
ncbi:MAG: cupin domain-containing protein [Bacteroidales bacterium]|jgi:uncharacterized cupin superfamily protein|nr:cupin domain-containing protein [Bacteroidales bacterium]